MIISIMTNLPKNTVEMVVVECYTHSPGRNIIVARRQVNESRGYVFLLASSAPSVDFGDMLLFNVVTGQAAVYRGNPMLTYSLYIHKMKPELIHMLSVNSPIL